MITEEHDIDLNLLSEHFTTCGDYTKDVILKELEYWRSISDFLVLVCRDGDSIDGFFIGYRNRNSLWIAQCWRKSGTDLATSKEVVERAKIWAKEHKMTHLGAETKRNEMKAMARFGWNEFSINMRLDL